MLSRARTIRSPIFAAVALIAVVSATSLAMSNTDPGNTDNAYYVATADPGVTISTAPVVKSSAGNAVTWGVFAYTSDRGLTCLQAGIANGEKTGAFTPKGFAPYSPLDAIGNCGDLSGAFATLGGAVYGASEPASTDLSDRANVVYGLIDKSVVKVTVTISKTSERLPVELSDVSELGDATQSFIAPLPPEASLPGVTVTFERANGEETVSAV